METNHGWRVGAGLLLALVATRAAAQDTNYWALQYGPVAQLLGGQVIGSDRDLSATYYNPGGLALGGKEAFLLSTESVQYEAYSTKASEGDVFNTSSDSFGTAPTLVAGALPTSWLGKDTRMAWSFLTRQKLDSELGQRRLDPLELQTTGNSSSMFYVASYVTENWGGVSAARALSDSLGLGVTLYGVYRGQRQRSAANLLGVSGPDALSIIANRDYSYSHFRFLAKTGVAWERNGMRFGLDVTTPSLGLFGSGDAGYVYSFSGLDADGDGVTDTPSLIAQSVDHLDATYRSSWAIGAGFAAYRGATRWHASVEWFAPVGRFSVLDVPPTGDVQLTLTQQLKSVLNAGIGVEHDFGNELAVYSAAFTDFSASTGEPDINVAVSNWNLYHVSAGAKFAFAGSRFTLGATFSFGSKARAAVLDAPPGRLPEQLEQISLDVRYRRVVLLLGFLFGKPQ
jgi:hypothetical protein